MRRVIHRWNAAPALWPTAVAGYDPVRLSAAERQRLQDHVAATADVLSASQVSSAARYVEALLTCIVDPPWSWRGAKHELRARLCGIDAAGYQRVQHFLAASPWDAGELRAAVAGSAIRSHRLGFYGVRDCWSPTEGWIVALDLLGRRRNCYLQIAFANPHWGGGDGSDDDHRKRHVGATKALHAQLDPDLLARLTDLGTLVGGWQLELAGARWCVEHHGDRRPWTLDWIRHTDVLVPGGASPARIDRHRALVSLAQSFLLSERSISSPLWKRIHRRMRARLSDLSLDDDAPYYWQDGRLD